MKNLIVMDWKTLFTNEAISNYVVFGSGLIIGLCAHLGRKYTRKPAVIAVEKKDEISLIQLRNDAQSRLKVTYQNEDVKNFYLSILDIKNRSSSTIDDVTIKIFIKNEQEIPKIYEVRLDDPMGDIRQPSSSATYIENKDGEGYFLVNIPYLNNEKELKDKITFYVYSNNPINISNVAGGGKGWRAFLSKKRVDLLDLIGKEGVSALFTALLALALGASILSMVTPELSIAMSELKKIFVTIVLVAAALAATILTLIREKQHLN